MQMLREQGLGEKAIISSCTVLHYCHDTACQNSTEVPLRVFIYVNVFLIQWYAPDGL